MAKKVNPNVTKMKQVNLPGLMVQAGKKNVLMRKKLVITEVRKLNLIKKI